MLGIVVVIIAGVAFFMGLSVCVAFIAREVLSR